MDGGMPSGIDLYCLHGFSHMYRIINFRAIIGFELESHALRAKPPHSFSLYMPKLLGYRV